MDVMGGKIIINLKELH